MKKLFAFVTALMMPLLASAQYRPLLEEDKVWMEYSSNPMWETNRVFYVSGDTIIDGTRYYKIYCRGTVRSTNDSYWKTVENSDQFYMALREEDRRVYDSKGNLLYDFSLQPGQTVVLRKDYRSEVIAVDTLVVGQQHYRRMLIRETYDFYERSFDDYWIEGIGTSFGLLKSSGWGVPDGGSKLVECRLKGDAIFTDDDYNAGGTRPEPKIAREGRTWNYVYGSKEAVDGRKDLATVTPDLQMTVCGDTIVMGVHAKNVLARSTRQYGDDDWHYVYSLREEQYRTYAMLPNRSLRWALMDLTRYENEQKILYSMESYRDGAWYVKGQTALTTQGHTYDAMVFSNGTSWIDAIGHSDSGIRIQADYEDRDSVNRYLLVSCYDGEQCIYLRSDVVENTPNSIVESRYDTHPSAFYDLQGRRLTTQPRRGIYVKDGKKVVVK